jgi:hypothetical protein
MIDNTFHIIYSKYPKDRYQSPVDEADEESSELDIGVGTGVGTEVTVTVVEAMGLSITGFNTVVLEAVDVFVDAVVVEVV